jgi:hypothetical protein
VPVGWQVGGRLVAAPATTKKCIVMGYRVGGGRYGNLFENFSKESSKKSRVKREKYV